MNLKTLLAALVMGSGYSPAQHGDFIRNVFPINMGAVQDEKLLATLPKDVEPSVIVYSSDKRSVAFPVPKGGGQAVSWIRASGEVFDGIHFMALSRDAQAIVYLASRQDHLFVVVNNTVLGPYDEGVTVPLAMAPNGKSVAFAVRGPNGSSLVNIGKETRTWDDIANPKYSRDGANLMYVARRGNFSFVVVNESKGEEYDSVGALQFAPDNLTPVYAASRSGKHFIIKGTKTEEVPYEVQGIGLDGEGGVRAYSAWNKEERCALVVSIGKQKEEIKVPSVSQLVASGKGEAIAYVVRDRIPSERVVLNGKASQAYDRVRNLSISSDGKAITYWASIGKKCFVVAGNVRSEEFEVDDNSFDSTLCPGPDFTEDGKRVIFGARKGQELWRKEIVLK